MPNSIRIAAIKVVQPIGEFYIGKIDASDLVAISYADVREMQRELDHYLGIQRRLDPSRVKEIAAYTRTSDATFPTSVLLAVRGKNAKWDEDKKTLTLVSSEGTPAKQLAKILDGQHRVAGLVGYDGPAFEVPVTIFIDADIADQAYVFSTVNLAQTKVNKSLVYDLFEYQEARSPQKTAHNVAVALDRLKGGPFYQRIKRLGYATQGRPRETLTQATVVEELLKYITHNKVADRDALLRGRRLPTPDSATLQKHPFRGLFVKERDSDIAAIVVHYFEAVRSKWPNAWEGRERGHILPKTNGFKALMSFMRRGYLELVGSNVGRVVSAAEFGRIFARVRLKEQDFTVDNFAPGSSGQAALKRALMVAISK